MGAADLAQVFRLLPCIIGELGEDALTAAKNRLEVDGLFWGRWHRLQVELVLVVTQIAIVQSQSPRGLSSFEGLEFK